MARATADDVLQALSLRSGRRRWIGAGLVALLLALLAAGCAPSVPDRQQDICAIFQQNRDWYDYAKDAEDEWGVPASILMAFVHQESSFRSDARPPRKYVLWIIPWGRVSSAKGYAQAQDPAWSDYTDERGSFFRSRSDMEDALDFIGWYKPRDLARARHRQDRRAQPLSRLPRGTRRLPQRQMEGQAQAAADRGPGGPDRTALRGAARALRIRLPLRFLVAGLASV